MSPLSFILILLVLIIGIVLWMARDPEFDDFTPTASPDSDSQNYPLPPSVVARIFSPEDRQFIARLRCSRLQRIYRRERSRVALYWVFRTSNDISKIMQVHRLASRRSRNLDVATETKLLFQYFKLRFLCGLLVLSIRSFGPHALTEIALQAGELYRGIGRALAESPLANRVATADDTTTH
jgi:hypothetical protein